MSFDQVADRLSQALPALPDNVLDDLATTAACLDRLSDHRDVRWAFDPALVRGMGYYTGQIFEVSHPQSSSSIAGGGRYDQLVGRSLGRDVPACGFSLGFERIMDLLDPGPKSETVALLYDVDSPLPDVLAAARALRADGRTVSVLGRRGQLGKQLARLETWVHVVRVLPQGRGAVGTPARTANAVLTQAFDQLSPVFENRDGQPLQL